MDSAFLEAMAAAIAARDIGVARFEFGYMAGRREGGIRRPPPKIAVLCDDYRVAVERFRARYGTDPLVIGGKSMGGRVASMIADEFYAAGQIKGCVCLGYPFHPAGRPETLRTAHLVTMRCPTLIVHGERDALGCRAEVEAYRLPNGIDIAWLADGDHDFKPRVASGFKHADHMASAAAAVARFVQDCEAA